MDLHAARVVDVPAARGRPGAAPAPHAVDVLEATIRCTRIPTSGPSPACCRCPHRRRWGPRPACSRGNSDALVPPINAWLNSRCGLPGGGERPNGALTAATGHAAPSLVNGSDVQLEDSATRASISGARWNVRRQQDPERRVEDELAAGQEVADEPAVDIAVRLDPRDVRHVAEERDVRAGRVAVGRGDRRAAVEQLEVVAADQARDEDRVLARCRCPPPTRPTARSACRASACPSARAGPPRRGAGRRSASTRPRRWSTPRRRRSRCPTCPGCWSGRRCRCPPPASGSRRRRWRRRRSWPRTPARCRAGPASSGPVSYQTTQATLSLAPVNAMSGSTPSRLGSTLSVGSPVADEPPFSVEPVQAHLLPAERAHAGRVATA